MALTLTQRATVRTFLGYTDLSAGLYSTLEGAMTALSAEGETIVLQVLTDLAAIEARLRTSWNRQAVKRAEDVELFGIAEITALRAEGARLVNQLAGIFGVAPLTNVFSAGARVGQAGRG